MAEPLTTIDQTLEQIWREVLKVPTVDPQDNFLDIGGNSLRAGEISARLRTTLGVDVPIDVVLSEESFADLARAVTAMVGGAAAR